jgi:hypothetical protein
MGCSASLRNEVFINNPRREKKLITELIKYRDNHSKFEKINFESKLEMKISQEGKFETYLDNYYLKNVQKFQEMKFTKLDLKQTILELAAYELLDDDFKFKTWDINDLVLDNIEHQEHMDEDKSEFFKKILELNCKFYPNKQRGCYMFCENQEVQAKIISLKAIFNNLKFNENYKMTAFSIFISNFLLKEENLFEEISEVIDMNPDLFTFSSIFYDDNIEFKPSLLQLQNLGKVIETVRDHRTIITFILGCKLNYNFYFPLETETKLKQLIQDDKLFCLTLSNLNLSNPIKDEIILILQKLTNLKFLNLNLKLNSEQFEKLVISISENKNIIGLILSSAKTTMTIEETEKKIKSFNPNFVFYHYEEKYKLVE